MKIALACCAVSACLLVATAAAVSSAVSGAVSGGGRQETRPAAAASADRGARTYDAKKRTLTSTARPAVRIKHGKDLKYIGTQSFTLYDVAHAEQHFFVDADDENRVRRFYWVQFEGYLPTNKNTYNYRSADAVKMGDFMFVSDARPVHIPTTKAQQRPDSDGARARAFIESKGYRMASDDMLWQRLVHMVDASKRDELMIIYMEDLGASGLVAEDFAEKGKAASLWKDVSAGLRERAAAGLELKKN